MKIYIDNHAILRTVILDSGVKKRLALKTGNNNRLLIGDFIGSMKYSNQLPADVVEIQSSQLTSIEKYALFCVIFDDDAVSEDTKKLFFDMVKS